MLYEAAVGAMKFLVEMGKAGHLEHAGISRGDFDRLISNIPWAGIERNRMTTALRSMMYGSLDVLSMPRLVLPAEWVAACIVVFVHPVNALLACHYMESAPDIETLSRKSDSGNMNKSGHVYADQIFALVVSLYASNERSQARQAFERNTGLSLEAVKKEKK